MLARGRLGGREVSRAGEAFVECMKNGSVEDTVKTVACKPLKCVARVNVLAFVWVMSLVLSACGSHLEAIGNHELAAKRDLCIQSDPTSPGKVTACENIRRECERRRTKGNYTC